MALSDRLRYLTCLNLISDGEVRSVIVRSFVVTFGCEHLCEEGVATIDALAENNRGQRLC